MAFMSAAAACALSGPPANSWRFLSPPLRWVYDRFLTTNATALSREVEECVMRNVHSIGHRSLLHVIAMLITLSLPFAASAATQRHAPIGWMGIGVSRQVTADGATVLRVETLLPYSAARRAGVRQGDVIEQIDGRAVSFRSDLEYLNFWLNLQPGQQVALTLVNGDQHRREVVTVDRYPREFQQDWLRMYADTAARENSALQH
jgi:predicted metalloprotease with PDZ domain